MGRLVRFKKIVILFLSFFMFFSLIACGKKSDKKGEESFKEVQYKYDDVFSSEDVIEDLAYIKVMVEKIHPNPYGNLTREEFDSKWVEMEEEIKEDKKFIDVNYYLQKAVAMIGDVNTYVEVIEDKNQLPLEFEWNGEGLWIKSSKIDTLKPGDKVLHINNVTVNELLKKFKDIIPSDNPYYRKSKAAKLLKERYICENLGIMSEENKLKIETIGNDSDIKIQYISFDISEDKNEPLKNEYKIDNSKKIASLEINNLNNDNEFSSLVEKFFTEIKGGEVNKVVIDLRKCETGEVEALNEILKYTSVESYTGYTVKVKKTEEAKKANIKGAGFFQNLFSRDKIKISRNKELVFDGDLYFLTSNNTSREASELVTIVKDNEIGKVVGQYTGANPNGYGKAVEVTVPNCKLKLKISTSKLTRPNNNAMNSALVPDIYVPVNSNKFKKGIDLEINEILKEQK